MIGFWVLIGAFIIFFGIIDLLYDKKHINMQETGRYYAFVEFEDSEGAENALKVNVPTYIQIYLYMHAHKKKKRGVPFAHRRGKIGLLK